MATFRSRNQQLFADIIDTKHKTQINYKLSEKESDSMLNMVENNNFLLSRQRHQYSSTKLKLLWNDRNHKIFKS
ncbi:hypothetical protein VNO78_06297 [Psophocarpus tetragonolobus]|uniref:Uncharacterized protein n=1 Tax=Psophocarpus tetragonolobus TaxID=3891 RepID=A0AAN9T1S8_PSOTE